MALNGQMMDRPLTIGSLIDHAARYHGGTEIISVEADGDVRCSDWAGVAVNACRLASALQRLGIGTGDRVGTLAWNHQRHLEIYFGVSSAGMICHTINPRLFADQLVYIIRHAADRAVFLIDDGLELHALLPGVSFPIASSGRVATPSVAQRVALAHGALQRGEAGSGPRRTNRVG